MVSGIVRRELAEASKVRPRDRGLTSVEKRSIVVEGTVGLGLISYPVRNERVVKVVVCCPSRRGLEERRSLMLTALIPSRELIA